MSPQSQRDIWLIAQPRYSLAFTDLRAETQAEQLPFEYRIYYFAQQRTELLLEERVSAISLPGFVLIQPGKAYRLKVQNAGSTLSLRIKSELIFELATRMGMDWIGREIFFVQNATGDIPMLRQLCEMLIAEVSLEQTGRQIVLDALITQISVLLLRNYLVVRGNPQLEISRVGIVDRRLRRALEYLHNHFAQELSLAEMAESAFLSEYHFAHLFKRIMGITPHQYLAAVRIEQAKRLIGESDQGIAAISAAVGYASQSHFTKVFRTITGLTPAKYREQLLRIK
jgi:AraC-like DNA-binding protein